MVQYKKTAIAIALSSTAVLSGIAQAAQISAAGYATTSSPVATTGNNYTLLDKRGTSVDGNNNTTMTWDGTVFTSSSDYIGPGGVSNMTLLTPWGLLSAPLTVHDIQVFAPGTYTFDTALGGGSTETGMQTLTVGAGQLGAHMLFDYGGGLGGACEPNGCNNDLLVLWGANGVFGNNANQQTLTGTAVWNAVSVDGDGDGIPGIKMGLGGAFGNFNLNFNLNGITPVPLPASVWLLGSGLLSMLGAARRRKVNGM